MVKRPGRDDRTGEGEGGEDTAERFRVDRVYAAPTRQSSPTIPARPAAAPSTMPPTEDRELALRRQLSKAQSQLADMQRELANKDEEFASEVEHRLLITAARDKLFDDMRALDARIEELQTYEARTLGVEQRLVESLARNEELAGTIEHERTQRTAAEVRVTELIAAIEDARIRRIDERAMLDEQHADELDRIEEQKRETLAGAGAAFELETMRMRQAYDAELAQLVAAHARSLATLRGELEPRVLEARSLAEERERLSSELVAVRSEAARDVAERTEAHRRELAQLVETHASELAAQARTSAAEVTRALGERDVEILEHQQTVRRAELRELEWEQSTLALRDTQTKLQFELASLTEQRALTEAAKTAIEERLATALQTNDRLVDEARVLRDQLEARDQEARRAARERQRLVTWLREGMSALGEAGPEDLTDEASEEEA